VVDIAISIAMKLTGAYRDGEGNYYVGEDLLSEQEVRQLAARMMVIASEAERGRV
jgi:hypothetical protein